MIQLATDPNASRSHPAGQDQQRNGSSLKRRGGHAWPFLSRQSEPALPESSKPTGDSAS